MRPPAPFKVVRRTLDLDFAVMLMRAGYSAVDDLDFVSMRDFQVRFFDIRSREWEKYLRMNAGLQQGLISDPGYFDFISYAQMLTIQRTMREPEAVFEEPYPDSDGRFHTRLVRRDIESYPSPVALLKAWQARVGLTVYKKFLEETRQQVLGNNFDRDALSAAVRQIYKHFKAKGFCFELNFKDGNADNDLGSVEMVAPCIMWGNQALKRVRSVPNDYDSLCVHAFAKIHNVRLECATTFLDSSILRKWSVT